MAKTRPSSKAAAQPFEPQIPARFKSVVTAFASRPGVTIDRGWRTGSVALKASGKLFAMLVDDTLVAKLPRQTVDALVQQERGDRFDPRRDGRVMKEWIVIARGAADWIEVAQQAYGFAREKATAARRGSKRAAE